VFHELAAVKLDRAKLSSSLFNQLTYTYGKDQLGFRENSSLYRGGPELSLMRKAIFSHEFLRSRAAEW
jgi:hypothetical protein